MTQSGRSQKHHHMIRQSSVTPMKKALLFGFITGANNRAGIGKPIGTFDMTKLTITIFVVALMSGCATGVETVRDLSTGEGTALIDGASAPGIFSSWSCKIIWPVFADSIVVDAGPVVFVNSCTTGETAVFRFDAKAGSTYEIRFDMWSCAKLLDVTTGNHTGACEKIFSYPFKDLSTSDDTAAIRQNLGATPLDYCNPVKEQEFQGELYDKVFGYLFVDAGPTTIGATCLKTGILGFNERTLTASFDFDAQAGHTYTFSAEDKECIKLLDITSDESVIACERYERTDGDK